MNTCPHCGKPIGTDAPQGICPQCLMKAAFATGGAPVSSYVPPSVEELSRHFPQLEIEISFSDRLIDLAQEGFDLAVRIGELPDTDRLSARRLGEQAIALAASPGKRRPVS